MNAMPSPGRTYNSFYNIYNYSLLLHFYLEICDTENLELSRGDNINSCLLMYSIHNCNVAILILLEWQIVIFID